MNSSYPLLMGPASGTQGQRLDLIHLYPWKVLTSVGWNKPTLGGALGDIQGDSLLKGEEILEVRRWQEDLEKKKTRRKLEVEEWTAMIKRHWDFILSWEWGDCHEENVHKATLLLLQNPQENSISASLTLLPLPLLHFSFSLPYSPDGSFL